MSVSPLLKPFKIGSVLIENPLILAPMAGITDYPFRRVIKKYPCALMYTEMVSVNALYFGNIETYEIIRFDDFQRPVAVQVFGSDIMAMKNAVKKLVELKADIIDLNLGCSVPKVIKSKSGAYLARSENLPLLKLILEILIDSGIPVTIKMRLGNTLKEITCFTIAEMAQKAGVSAITLHARTSKQEYKGNADWSKIKKLKDLCDIPVIGNGDIKTPEDCRKMLEETGCDGVMIGRACLGQPWFFKFAYDYLEKGFYNKDFEPSLRLKTIIEHFEILQTQRQAEFKAVLFFRKFLAWYTKGLPFSANLRKEIFKLTSYAETYNFIEVHIKPLMLD